MKEHYATKMKKRIESLEMSVKKYYMAIYHLKMGVQYSTPVCAYELPYAIGREESLKPKDFEELKKKVEALPLNPIEGIEVKR